MAQNNLINAQAAESQSRANKYAVEADFAPKETVLKYSDADKDGSLMLTLTKGPHGGDFVGAGAF